jgi:hypothetical protein
VLELVGNDGEVSKAELSDRAYSGILELSFKRYWVRLNSVVEVFEHEAACKMIVDNSSRIALGIAATGEVATPVVIQENDNCAAYKGVKIIAPKAQIDLAYVQGLIDGTLYK